MTEETKEVTQEAQAQENQNVDLTITDLTNIKSIIDVAASRGAFKPAEMAAVGTVYNKLSGFLDTVAKQAQAQQAQTQQQG
jgi:hypothetical protein